MVFSQNFRQAIPVDLCPADDGFPHANFGRKVIKKTRGNRMGWVNSMGFNGIWWDMNGKGDLVGWLWDDYGMIMEWLWDMLLNVSIFHPRLASCTHRNILQLSHCSAQERGASSHTGVALHILHMGLRLCVRLMEPPNSWASHFGCQTFNEASCPSFTMWARS